MVTLGKNDHILVRYLNDEGLPEYDTVTIDGYDDYAENAPGFTSFTVGIDSTICPRILHPSLSRIGKRHPNFGYRVYTASDLDGTDVHGNFVSDGYQWGPPTTHEKILRIYPDENQRLVAYLEPVTDLEEYPLDREYILTNRMQMLDNAPVGLVINEYPQTSIFNTYLPTYDMQSTMLPPGRK